MPMSVINQRRWCSSSSSSSGSSSSISSSSKASRAESCVALSRSSFDWLDRRRHERYIHPLILGACLLSIRCRLPDGSGRAGMYGGGSVPRMTSRSATATPTGSPKRRHLPQIPSALHHQTSFSRVSKNNTNLHFVLFSSWELNMIHWVSQIFHKLLCVLRFSFSARLLWTHVLIL